MLVRGPESDSLSMFIGTEKAAASNAFEEEDLINIFSDESVETLKRKIVSTYLAGYTTISLEIESRTRISPLCHAVRDLVRNNLGALK
jgi:hypothetical protein